MRDQVLTLNAGSSSIRFALFDAAGSPQQANFHGLADGLGLAAHLRIRDGGGVVVVDQPLPAPAAGASPHDTALAAVLAWLASQPGLRVACVGHRIVHGGSRFASPALIDDAVLAQIHALVPLAPLHQPHNLSAVHAARHSFAGIPQVACFDTAFHQGQSDLNRRFALPQALHDRGIRRYGFHGLSYASICRQFDAATLAGRSVIAHLGNGASLCAVQGGRSVATTMSFSPLDGLPMGTRCGRLDPAVVLHLLDHEGMDTAAVTRLLTRESGLLGLSGLSSDMRVLLASTLPAAVMAVDYFVEQVLREVAAMAAALRGIDNLVFTGGIGENAAGLRARVVAGLAWLGVGSRVKVHVMQTNEEAMIATHTLRLLAPGPPPPPEQSAC